MSDQSTPVIAIENLHKTFDTGEAQVEALRGVDLTVGRGQFLSIMGPSGSGKSTLLHLLGGLDLPTQGTVRLDGTDISTLDDDALTLFRRRRIGFIFQAFNLLDVLTSEENVAIPLLVDGIPEREAHQRAAEALERVGIGHRRGHWPGKMSGGEQQRVAIARALVTSPALILADEPTGNLDSVNGDQILNLLRGLADEHQHTIVMVTHDPKQAARADRLIRLKDGQIQEDQMLTNRSMEEVLADLIKE